MVHPRFDYCSSRELPPLGWVAVVNGIRSDVRVVHGRHVERFDQFFVEGVWAGDFTRGEFANSDCVFGSGARVDGDKLTFVSSTATTDYLYYSTRNGTTCVSNSLPLLLRQVNDRLEPKYVEYADINQSIQNGIRKYRSDIPTKNGNVQRLMHFNLEIAESGSVVVDKPLPPRFKSFAGYEKYLKSTLLACLSNARDPVRRTKLHVYSTQSKGYDSTAVNAMAREGGVDAVFTVQQGKANDRSASSDARYQTDDDGSSICGMFHLPVIALDRREFEKGILEELYYWAGMHTSSDINLCGIAVHLKPPALLLTGNLGEIWYTSASTEKSVINDGLIPLSLGGWGLSEVRLKLGYVQVAVPFIGARSREDIFRISESREMERWRLGGAYDRPIPRRIAEQAGIPRHMFGQRKQASVVEFPPPNIPFDGLLREEYFEFLRGNGLLSDWGRLVVPLVHAYNSFATYKGPKQNLHAYRIDRLIQKLTSGKSRLENLWQKLDGSVYCFAVNKLAEQTDLSCE